MKQCFVFSNFKAAFLTELALYARISSESVAPLLISDVVQNAKSWILKAREGKK